jgi:hypothetical protein
MSADTLAQISEVRTGHYTDWHAGLLMVIWRPFWLIGIGPGWVLWAAIVTFVFGLYGVLRFRFRRLVAVAITAGITVLPQVVGYVIYLGRDMWFMAFFLVACAALLLMVQTSGRMQLGAIALLCTSSWLMQASRQNALPAVAILLFAMVWLCWPRRSTRARGSVALMHVFKCLAVTVLLVAVVVSSQMALRHAFGVKPTHIEQAVFIYDLAAISHAEREVLFDSTAFPAQDLAVLDAHFDPSSAAPLIFGPGAVIPYPLPGEEVARLRAEWIDAIRSHPIAYLKERLTLGLEQVSVTEPSVWVTHPGVDANPWGYTAAFPSLDRGVQEYIRLFADDQLRGGIVYRVWPYLLVLVAGLGYLRSAKRTYRCLGWMSVASLAYQASLFFGLMGTGYRLNVSSVVIALVICVVASADVVGRFRQRRAQPELAAIE